LLNELGTRCSSRQFLQFFAPIAPARNQPEYCGVKSEFVILATPVCETSQVSVLIDPFAGCDNEEVRPP
jgi:hypothetical protein